MPLEASGVTLGTSHSVTSNYSLSQSSHRPVWVYILDLWLRGLLLKTMTVI